MPTLIELLLKGQKKTTANKSEDDHKAQAIKQLPTNKETNDNEEEDEIAYKAINSIRNRPEEKPLFLALCKWYINNPKESTLDFVKITAWLTPSYHYSNGRCLKDYELDYFELIPILYPAITPRDWHQQWLLLNWLELEVNIEVQAELVEWMKIEAKKKLLDKKSES